LAASASCAFTYALMPLTVGAHSTTTSFSINGAGLGRDLVVRDGDKSDRSAFGIRRSARVHGLWSAPVGPWRRGAGDSAGAVTAAAQATLGRVGTGQ
jgi:hypothetical protein